MFATARLNEAQIVALAKAIEGRDVHDFGCGTGVFTRALEQLEPKRVVGIDKERMAMELANKHMRTAITTFVCADFETYNWNHAREYFDVGLVSWPLMRVPGLVQLIQRCKTVVYVGKNTDLTACGGPDLFRHLVTRRVVEYLPAFHNVLCVYGEVVDEPRPITGEELAAVRQWGGATESYTMEQAEAKANESLENSVLYARLARVTI